MQKVLLVRFSSIGDIILCSGLIRNLKKAYPKLELHALTKANFHELWADNPNVDKVLHWENEVHRDIWRRESYDLIIDLHQNLRSLQVKWWRWDVPNVGFSKQNLRKFFLVMTKSKRFSAKPIVDRYAQILSKLGITYDGLGLDVYGEVKPKDAEVLPSAFIVCVLGGSFLTKQVPESKWISFFEHWDRRLPIVLIGSKQEQKMAARLESAFPNLVYNGCGKWQLMESVWVVKQAKVVVSGDTGLGHVAAAFGKPLLWIWGSTSKEIGMLPPVKPNSKGIIEMSIEGLNCRPCSKLGFQECPKQHFRCMDHSAQLWTENLEKLSGSTLG